MPKADTVWRRRRTLEAAWVLLCWRLAVGLVPMRVWIRRVGTTAANDAAPIADEDLATARRLARHVERAAQRLPFPTLCLPRALALGAMLRRRSIAHAIVIAARPADLRGGDDSLHAWASVGHVRVIGDLPGPWIPVVTLYAANPEG